MQRSGVTAFSALRLAAQSYYGKTGCLIEPSAKQPNWRAVLPNPRRYKPNGTSRYVEKQSGADLSDYGAQRNCNS